MDIFSHIQWPKKIIPAFTIIEIGLTIAALGILTGLIVPNYIRYSARTDIEIARQNIAQGLERARFLSQVGMNDSQWGFSTDAIPGRGVLFMGNSFAERDTAFDELYSIPQNLTVSGLSEVTFEKITGAPSVTGDIIIHTQYNDEAKVTVTIGNDGQVDIPTDWLDICIHPFTENSETIKVPDSLWQTYQAEGAIIGACSNSIETNSSTSSAVSSNTSSINFVVSPEGGITPATSFTYTAKVIGTSLRIASGYDAPITVKFKNGSGPFVEPWGDFTKPIDGNINKPNIPIFTSDAIDANNTIDIWARSYYKNNGWSDGTINNHFSIKNQVTTSDNSNLVYALRNGDAVPNYSGAGDQPNVEDFLEEYINPTTHTIMLGANQVIYLFELWTTDLSSSAADFQDLILLVTINPLS